MSERLGRSRGGGGMSPTFESIGAIVWFGPTTCRGPNHTPPPPTPAPTHISELCSINIMYIRELSDKIANFSKPPPQKKTICVPGLFPEISADVHVRWHEAPPIRRSQPGLCMLGGLRTSGPVGNGEPGHRMLYHPATTPSGLLTSLYPGMGQACPGTRPASCSSPCLFL